MVQAAAADGIQLSGSGYRDPAQQEALREQRKRRDQELGLEQREPAEPAERHRE